MTLSPEDIEKLRTKELANCIRKLNAGKTLTRDERRMLDAAHSSSTAAAGAGLQTSVNYASTWDELGQLLGVSRRSILKWRERQDLAGALPRPRADGRHDVAAWKVAMVTHGLAGSDESASLDYAGSREGEDGAGVDPGAPKNLRDWKVQREMRIVRKLDIDIDHLEGRMLVAADLEVPLGATFAAIQTKLSQFPARAARFLVGIREESVAEEKLRDEMDAVIADLHSTSYIDEPSSPGFAGPRDGEEWDEETERLFALVSFDGQDREALLRLVEQLVRLTLARIGRRVIQDAMRANPETECTADDDQAGSPDAAALPAAARLPREAPAPPRPVDPGSREGALPKENGARAGRGPRSRGKQGSVRKSRKKVTGENSRA
ncbi:MAG: hypothetical protein ABSE62_05000 [Chthoniobacteraceae bacterium]